MWGIATLEMRPVCPDRSCLPFASKKTLKKKVLAKRHRKKIDKNKFYLFI